MKSRVFTIITMLTIAAVALLSSCKEDYTDMADTAYSTYSIHGYVMDSEKMPVKDAMVIFKYNKVKGSDAVMELISDTTYTDITGYYNIERNSGIQITGDFVIQVALSDNHHIFRNVARHEFNLNRSDYDMENSLGRYGLASKNIDMEIK